MIIKAKDIQRGDIIVMNISGKDFPLRVTKDIIRSKDGPGKIYLMLQGLNQNLRDSGFPKTHSYYEDSPVEIFSRLDPAEGDIIYEDLCL